MDWVHVMAGFFGKEICLFRTEEERERERERLGQTATSALDE